MDPSRADRQGPAKIDGEFRVEFEWRGETATYFERDRSVMLSCIYWGGPKGSVAHMFGAWEYADGRREPMTSGERLEVLRRVAERSASNHGIRLEIEGE